MQLHTHRRSRAAVGVAAAVAVTAGSALLATPATAAADPAAGISCNITDNGAASLLGVYCYDDVAMEQATVVDYQWERDGVAIPGATSSTYGYQSGDKGHLFSATVGVDRDGATVTVPIGRAGATNHQALYLMDGCNVTVSDKYGNAGGGASLLDGAHLNDTLTLDVWPAIASNLTVAGPYWSMTTASSGQYVLPPALADQAEGWTVTLSDLASIDAILGHLILAPGRPVQVIGLEERGQVEVSNSFTVSAGDVSATVGGCPWGPDTPSGQLNDGVFNGSRAHQKQTPDFPIAEHASGDTGVQGVLTANTVGWNPIGVYDATTFTYQWTRDGQAIAGATSGSYTLTAEDSGKKIGLVIWGTLHETTVWIWGEVTAGEIEAPAPGETTSPTSSPSTAADPEQTGTVDRGAAAAGTKAQSGTPSSLASTGSTVLPVVIVALLLLAAGAVTLVVRRRAHQLG